MKVAFIGLGNMGAGIASCIQSAGFELTVWNRTAAKTEPYVGRGAKAAATMKEAASGADVIFTCLMDDRSVIEAVRAPDGILAGMKKSAIHVCVTTISPKAADELTQIHRAAGTHYVSGAVVGRPDAAASGTLASYLAGDKQAVEAVMPAVKTYSAHVFNVSDKPSIANAMKLAINYNVVSVIELIGETYVFAEKCGVPLEAMRDFYQQLWFAHPAAKMYAEKLRKRDFAGRGGFVMTGGLKDVRAMLSTAEAVGASLDIGKIIERKIAKAVDAGMGETDWSAFYEITRQEADLK